MSTPQHIVRILQKRLQQQPVTEEESLQLKEWWRSMHIEDTVFGDEKWEKALLHYLQLDADEQSVNDALQRFRMTAGIKQQTNAEDNLETLSTPVPSATRVRLLKRWAWAAAAIFVIGVGLAIVVISDRKSSVPQVASNHNRAMDIFPGTNKAILTLSDGKTISLDSAANGTIAQQGHTSIAKNANGQIFYFPEGNAVGEAMINTVTTPRGGQYQITLPDGTAVWLNAASSITYPAAFTGNQRKITLSGEAYLEVAKNPAQPFSVSVNGTAIEVLGTGFNVNAYEEEKAIKTTLVSGSVRVFAGALVEKTGNNTFGQPSFVSPSKVDSRVLTPGQQSMIRTGEGDKNITVDTHADIEQALAWKNGIFDFNGADLHAVMRQLERWYDIKVLYDKPVPNIIFRGKMYRNVSLSDVLDMMKRIGVECRLESRNLIVG